MVTIIKELKVPISDENASCACCVEDSPESEGHISTSNSEGDVIFIMNGR